MIKTRFILSTKGLLTFAFIILLVWLLRDYTAWRQSRQNKLKSKGEEETTATNNAEQVNKTEKKNTRIENLSIAHYILVTPFAAVYIVARAILDAIRFSLYFIIWSCEKALPHIDDWLFEKVTIWLPNTYHQFETWWIEKGQPNCTYYKNHFQQHILPSIINGIETFVTTCFTAACIVHRCSQHFIPAWKRFIERPDWHQLVTDLGQVAYTVFYIPLVWLVTRSIRLAKLVYGGLRAAAVSIQQDLIWICTVPIPATYNYIASTRLAKWITNSIATLSTWLQLLCLLINDYLLAPTLGRCLTWIVKGIDQLITVLQTQSIQVKLRRLYRWLGPNLVWTIFEVSGMVNQLATWAHFIFNQMIYPAYQLFIQHVVPRLSVAYQAIVVRFQLHLYPAWLKIYPYLNTPLFFAYTKLTATLRGFYILVVNHVPQQLLSYLRQVCSKVIQFSFVYAQWAYHAIQIWLMKQAPVLFSAIEKLYQSTIHACDWQALQQDLWQTMTALYELIAKQSDMVYQSLERSLSTWASEQGHNLQKDKIL